MTRVALVARPRGTMAARRGEGLLGPTPSRRGRHSYLLLVALVGLVEWGGVAMAFTITSPAFQQGASIPSQYTCDGADVSPPLQWNDAPSGTKSFALIADDPDAPMGTWVHWIVYNIPAGEQGLPEHVPTQEKLSSGAMQGLTGFHRAGYGGPCPPSGTHRYVFKLYALDAALTLPPNATKAQLLAAMKEHTLARCELTGTYRRSR